MRFLYTLYKSGLSFLRIFVRAASRRKARYITLLPYELSTPCKTANHITCEAFHPRWYVCDFYFLLCLLATLVIRTITLPSIAKVDDSHCGKSRFSGRRSDISFVAQNVVTTFARIGRGPEPSTNDEVRPTWAEDELGAFRTSHTGLEGVYLGFNAFARANLSLPWFYTATRTNHLNIERAIIDVPCAFVGSNGDWLTRISHVFGVTFPTAPTCDSDTDIESFIYVKVFFTNSAKLARSSLYYRAQDQWTDKPDGQFSVVQLISHARLHFTG